MKGSIKTSNFSYEIQINEDEDAPIKIEKKFRVLNSSNPEDYLALMREFERISVSLNAVDAAHRFNLPKL